MASSSTSRPRKKRLNGEGGYWYSASENRYRAQYIDLTGKTRSLSARTEADITRKLVEATNARDTGLLGGIPTATPTLGAWLKAWHDRSTHLAPSTSKRYALDIDLHIAPHLGAVRLDKVTPLAVENLYRHLQAGGLSANTVRHTHAVLRASFREAFRLGVVAVNVMDRVRAPKAVATHLTPPSLNQAKAVLECASTRGTRTYARWALALRWGPRQGEALGLRWSDVDLDTGLVQIRQALQRRTGEGLVMTTPKSRAGRREFCLDPDTLAALVAWRRDQVVLQVASPCWGDSDVVFTTDIGTPIDPRNDYEEWRTLLKAAGLPHFRVHDCRHTAATYILQQGISERVLMEILGHSQISLTMNTYAHVTAEALQDAARRVGEMYA